MNTQNALPPDDLKILRELGAWQAAAATSTRNRECVDAWLKHDAGAPDRRPMLLVETRSWEGDHGPVRPRDLRCRDPWARDIEYGIRNLRHHVEVFRDDHVVPPFVNCPLAFARTDFGVPSGRRSDPGAATHSFHYVPPLTRLDDADFARLRHRVASIDRDATARQRGRLEAVFGGLLPVECHDAPWQFNLALTQRALDLVGLEGFMLLMYDHPEGLHRLMAFLRDDQMQFVDFLEAEAAWSLNNGPDYVGAGSVGYTRALPAPGFTGRVRAIDRWAGFESQESVSISPEQFAEFVFPYMQPLMARFGRVYYGCCEPVDRVWDCLKSVPNLARISVSPWADEAFCGRACRERGIAYSRKPAATFVSGERFDEAALADHFAKTVDAAQGCRLEIIQRDIYVTNHQPERFVRWVALARDAFRRWRA